MRHVIGAGVAAVGVMIAGARLLRRRFAVVTVSGDSMRPTFHSGDHVLVRRRGHGVPQVGLVVLLEKPHIGGDWVTPPARWPGTTSDLMIKRVAGLPGDPWPEPPRQPPAEDERPQHPLMVHNDGIPGPIPPGSVVVFGDNPYGSFDSRAFGYYPASRILGTVVRRLGGG